MVEASRSRRTRKNRLLHTNRYMSGHFDSNDHVEGSRTLVTAQTFLIARRGLPYPMSVWGLAQVRLDFEGFKHAWWPAMVVDKHLDGSTPKSYTVEFTSEALAKRVCSQCSPHSSLLKSLCLLVERYIC